MQYFKSGYTANPQGVPEGELEDVTVDKYHKDSEGNILEDEYTPKYPGGYPAQVTFDMIPEAKDDGWVPLQVFVPVMEELGLADNNPGMKTQQIYGKDIWLAGGADLISLLRDNGLIDEMIITYTPEVFEKGIALFSEAPEKSGWVQIENKEFDSSMIRKIYRCLGG